MKRITVVVLAVSLLMLFGALTPAFAKNFNYPEGQNISYYRGAKGFIATPAGYFGPVTLMRIRANDVEIGTHGFRDNIEIYFALPTQTGPVYLHIAFYTTNPNPDVIDWLKILLNGFPCAGLPDNMRHVSDYVLIVNRH